MDLTGSITSSAGSNGSSVAGNVGNLSETAHDKIDQAATSIKPAVDRFARSAHQMVDKVATVASDAADTLGVKADQFNGTQQKLTEQCENYIRENPLASIGIAVAAGYILSKVLSSR